MLLIIKLKHQKLNTFILLFHHCALLIKERAKYATLLHCRTREKQGLKRSDKMAAQNEPNFALFTCKARKFSMSSLVTFSILTNQINDTSLVLFMSFARVLCNQYDARQISKTKSQNTKKWRNDGIINPLLDGLTNTTSGHFAHCSYFSSSLRARNNITQLEKYPRVLFNNYPAKSRGISPDLLSHHSVLIASLF